MAILIILLLPIPKGTYKDGGTKEYSALAYKAVVWNRLCDDVNEDGNYDSTNIYHKTSVYWFPDNQNNIEELWELEFENTDKFFGLESMLV